MDNKRVERIWRWKELTVPQKHPKRGRLAAEPADHLSMCTPGYGSRLRWPAACDLMTSSTRSASSLSSLARPSTFGPRTDRSSRRKQSGRGYAVWEYRPCSLNPAAPGIMARSKVSPARCGINCSMARASKRGGKPRCSSNAGGSPTTKSARTARWAINHRLLRPGNLGKRTMPRLTRDVGQPSGSDLHQHVRHT